MTENAGSWFLRNVGKPSTSLQRIIIQGKKIFFNKSVEWTPCTLENEYQYLSGTYCLHCSLSNKGGSYQTVAPRPVYMQSHPRRQRSWYWSLGDLRISLCLLFLAWKIIIWRKPTKCMHFVGLRFIIVSQRTVQKHKIWKISYVKEICTYRQIRGLEL